MKKTILTLFLFVTVFLFGAPNTAPATNETDFFIKAVENQLDMYIKNAKAISDLALIDSQIHSESYVIYVAFLNRAIAYEHVKQIMLDVRAAQTMLLTHEQDTIPILQPQR